MDRVADRTARLGQLVEIDGLFGLTVRISDSQALVAPWLLASPLYTACQYHVRRC